MLGYDHLDLAASYESINLVFKKQAELGNTKKQAWDSRRTKLGAHDALTKQSERLAAGVKTRRIVRR